MEQNLKLAILGADGRMGRAVISAMQEIDGISLSVALTHAQSPYLGQDALALAGVAGAGTSTTGFTASQTEALRQACQDIALLQSGNFSLGVNMLEALVGNAP